MPDNLRMPSQLPWLEPDAHFPDPTCAWGATDPAPGLLAAGGALSTSALCAAYAQGTFPWYGSGQPILWWAPDPRMVLPVADFRLHRSLRKTLQAFRKNGRCEIRVDNDFAAVIHACATKERDGQAGTWIVPEMIAAYIALHEAGHAHSVETWIDGRLAGGLYCVALGKAVFGESMFAHSTDASKIALSALICLCKQQGVTLIDCQQNTQHLASLGAHEISRAEFLTHVEAARKQPGLAWRFDPVYWTALLPTLTPMA